MSTFDDYIEQNNIDDTLYDVDAMQADYENNNFDIDQNEYQQYYMPSIVAESVINGQIKQAREQMKQYGLSGSHIWGYVSDVQFQKLIGE